VAKDLTGHSFFITAAIFSLPGILEMSHYLMRPRPTLLKYVEIFKFAEEV
jgi:hypothetical protein